MWFDLWFDRWLGLWLGQWLDPAQMASLGSIALLIAAAGLDYGVGDPRAWPHPVQLIGKAITAYSLCFIRSEGKTGRIAGGRPRLSPGKMKLAGIGLTLALVGGTGLSSWAGLHLLAQVSPGLSWLIETSLLASCFAGRSLRRAAEDVLAPLACEDLPLARERLAQYVGRDTQTLSKGEIYRAVLETVSENAIDGVLAPLFYAVLGASVGAAAPVALAYKAASTLDSMVGYREAPFTDFGWCSARLEDGLTWLPCRLSVLAVAALSGRPGRVLRLCLRDAGADPSPNAGWSECAYAAALGVQLGGPNTYRGQLKNKPLLGEAERPISTAAIARALELTRWSFLLGLSAGSALLLQ